MGCGYRLITTPPENPSCYVLVPVLYSWASPLFVRAAGQLRMHSINGATCTGEEVGLLQNMDGL